MEEVPFFEVSEANTVVGCVVFFGDVVPDVGFEDADVFDGEVGGPAGVLGEPGLPGVAVCFGEGRGMREVFGGEDVVAHGYFRRTWSGCRNVS